MVLNPNHPDTNSVGYVLEHRIIAEEMLGRYLVYPEGAHHINGIKDDNRKENITVTKNHLEHSALHRERRAFDACGNSTNRKCWICKKWDDPKNLFISKSNRISYHRECYRIYRSSRSNIGA